MIKLNSILKQMILEGGNIFGDTSPIKKENIDPTLNVFATELSNMFPKKVASFRKFETLGSVGKKPVSGDIDLAYDIENLMPGGKPDLVGWGIDPYEFKQSVEKIQKRARTATLEQSQLRAMIEFIGNKINEQSDIIQTDIKKSGAGSLFCKVIQYDVAGDETNKTVQVDINIGDPKWLRFSYYSATYKGNVKGLHRTQLLVALFTHKDKMFKHAQGVFNKDTRELEAKTPEETLELLNKLYGIRLDQNTLDDYFKLMDVLKKNLTDEDLHSIYDIYLKILDSTRADIPEDLQQYWIQNKERLGLKGKFLPDDSKLKQYIQ
jgi:hypothetical protein